MRIRIALSVVCLLAATAVQARAEQMIVFFRHGEKPASGNGQITCQGLNRAQALPTVLFARYGTPAYLYAPNPGVKITDPGGSFNYIRLLATTVPTAVKLGGSPVNAKYSYWD